MGDAYGVAIDFIVDYEFFPILQNATT